MIACTVDMAFELVLDRTPDPEGGAYWTQEALPTVRLLEHLTHSEEGRAVLWASNPGSLFPLADAIDIVCGVEAQPDGWVDLGHGVYGPPVLLRVRGCESWGDPLADGNYAAKNPASSARGAWQFLTKTWRWVTGRSDYATDATPAEQDAAAVRLLELSGWDAGSTQAWDASEGCWR